MNTQRSTEIKVGAVTILSLFLLVGGIIVGRGLNVASGKPTVTMLFPNSGGLDASSPVFVNGVKRGVVASVEPQASGVLITATLDNTADIRQDAAAKILMLEITGGRKVEITPGTSSTALPAGMAIRGATAADVSDVIALVGDVGDDAKRIIKRLDTAVAELNHLLGDGQFVADTRQTMRDLRSVAHNADDLLTRNKGNLQRTLDNLADVSADLKRLSRKNGPVDSLVVKVDAFLADANKLIGGVDNTLKGADKLVAELNALMSDLKTRKSVVHNLLYDEPTGKRLDSLLITLKKFFDNLPTDGVNVNVRLGSRP
jgi:phospholipid/cholesterol/gamma-HCH transport system substrate-binding protein